MDYKDKIRKLLALSESPVEAEATAALLKARELMAKHKIEQGDLEPSEREEIVKKVLEDITFFSRKDCWLTDVLCVFNNHFPVLVTATKYPNSKSNKPCISGFKQDVDIVSEMVLYIYDSVHTWAKKYCKENGIGKGKQMTNTVECFGLGFSRGWEEALKKQEMENPEWGLALVKPDVSSLVTPRGTYTPKYSITDDCAINHTAISQGYKEGYQYGSTKRLQENA